jgi:DNA mismatch endonuclease (patch repair protein)
MRAIRSKGMKPEMTVRRLVHGMGYRFRLHCTNLSGKPDLVFSSRRKVIFVHGCFWHSHGCQIAHTPKSNLGYWRGKLKRNKERDKRSQHVLKAAGWKALVIWECEVKRFLGLSKGIERFLK